MLIPFCTSRASWNKGIQFSWRILFVCVLFHVRFIYFSVCFFFRFCLLVVDLSSIALVVLFSLVSHTPCAFCQTIERPPPYPTLTLFLCPLIVSILCLYTSTFAMPLSSCLPFAASTACRYTFMVRVQHFNRNGKIVDLTLFYGSWWRTCASIYMDLYMVMVVVLVRPYEREHRKSNEGQRARKNTVKFLCSIVFVALCMFECSNGNNGVPFAMQSK